MKLDFKIKFLNIYESYFKGKVDFRGDEYTINIQSERRGKVVKVPFHVNTEKSRFLVRLSGPNDIVIEDMLEFRGESEWVEIDSDIITFFVADHQDQFDIVEILDGSELAETQKRYRLAVLSSIM